MFDLTRWITELDPSSIPHDKWQNHVNLIARLFHVSSCYLLQYNHKGYRMIVGSREEYPLYHPGVLIPHHDKTLQHEVIQQGGELYIPNALARPEWMAYPEVANGVVSYLGLPLHWPNGAPFGVLCVMDRRPSDYREPYFELIGTFRQQIEGDLRLLVSEQELSALSLTDELTGIYNRHGFNTLAQHKLSVAKRYGHSFGLMYFDLDNLHSINEQLGHETGDQAIIALANALDSELRDSDIAARIGSDEFAALVFVQQADDLENLAVRIQRKLHLLKQCQDSLPPITTSVGARCYQANTKLDISTMLHEVDQLMFSIKHEKKQVSSVGVIPRH